MRRILATLAVLAAAPLAGCGGSTAAPPAPAATATATSFRAAASAACAAAKKVSAAQRARYATLDDMRADRDHAMGELKAALARYEQISTPASMTSNWERYVVITADRVADVHMMLYGPPDLGSISAAAARSDSAKVVQAKLAQALAIPACIPE
jgi:hypothetical protein